MWTYLPIYFIYFSFFILIWKKSFSFQYIFSLLKTAYNKIKTIRIRNNTRTTFSHLTIFLLLGLFLIKSAEFCSINYFNINFLISPSQFTFLSLSPDLPTMASQETSCLNPLTTVNLRCWPSRWSTLTLGQDC